MSFEVAYTAFTRATKLEHIHLDTKKLKKNKSEFGRQIFKESNNILDNGIIYEIKDGPLQYVGMTTGTLEKQLDEHKNDPNLQFSNL